MKKEDTHIHHNRLSLQSALAHTIHTINISHKKVFLRLDLNVSLDPDTAMILSDYKLHAIRPTLDLLHNTKATIIIATHWGKPTHHDLRFSTRHLIPWFTQHNYTVTHIDTLEAAEKIINITHEYNTTADKPVIILLENMRFYEGENPDAPEIVKYTFAQQLKQLSDYYINDAFGALHRSDTSMTILPTLFTTDNRSIGLLIHKELHALMPLITQTEHPFVMISGGKKINTKLPMLIKMLDVLDIILLCPALVFTLLKAQGYSIGESFYEPTYTQKSLELITQAQEKNVVVVLPSDFQMRHTNTTPNFTQKLISVNAHDIPANGVGISIGPKTVEQFIHHIQHAKIVVYNGPMGFIDQPDTLNSTQKILQAMIDSRANGTRIIGGGDTIACAQQFNMLNGFDHISTGGGSMMALLSDSPLPALDILAS